MASPSAARIAFASATCSPACPCRARSRSPPFSATPVRQRRADAAPALAQIRHVERRSSRRTRRKPRADGPSPDPPAPAPGTRRLAERNSRAPRRTAGTAPIHRAQRVEPARSRATAPPHSRARPLGSSPPRSIAAELEHAVATVCAARQAKARVHSAVASGRNEYRFRSGARDRSFPHEPLVMPSASTIARARPPRRRTGRPWAASPRRAALSAAASPIQSPRCAAIGRAGGGAEEGRICAPGYGETSKQRRSDAAFRSRRRSRGLGVGSERHDAEAGDGCGADMAPSRDFREKRREAWIPLWPLWPAARAIAAFSLPVSSPQP